MNKFKQNQLEREAQALKIDRESKAAFQKDLPYMNFEGTFTFADVKQAYLRGYCAGRIDEKYPVENTVGGVEQQK